MIGFRSVLAGSIVFLAVAAFLPWQSSHLGLEWVATRQDLHVMRNEVTIAQWRQCVVEGGCSFMPRPGLGAVDDMFPVTGVGALDAQEFVNWAAQRTGKNVRLPTLDEWHGFSALPPVRPARLFTDPRLAWAATYGSESKIDPTLRHQGGFGENELGVSDVKGNVWEWTSSCVMKNASARCPGFFAAGSHDAKISIFVRDPSTGGCATGTPPAHVGLRLVYGGAAEQ